ncbi:MAG: 6-hydroxymethylpterin diphosphokinase MptE-like protein [Parachlamydiales bacterium]|jgi:hypothetical protein
MHNEKLFHKNLQLWASTHPKEAFLLPYREDPDLQFCQTGNEQENLVRITDGKSWYYHSPEDAVAEAEKWKDQLRLEKKNIVYIFGIGLGYYYNALKPWLKKDRTRSVVFFENDLAVVKSFLQTQIASKFLKDPQAALYYFEDLEKDSETFDAMYWNYIHTQMEVSALALYETTQKLLTEELHHKIIYDASIKNALVEEYLRFGANFFKNFYANELYFADSYLGNKLFGKMPDIPAIICGAGPSLNKALPLLKNLRENAVIFAGGSALNALSNEQILPHFGGGIDPNPTQLDRLSTSSGFEVPFFYRNRILHQAFRKIHGPHLYITGAGGYDVADWFEEQLQIPHDEYIDEGHNIVNFCLQIASRLGCNPIIFVGMDLGYSGMQTYASGIESKVSITKEELTSTGDFDKDAILRTDINGEPLYTLWKWIAESNWIGAFAKDNPGITLINSSEAGLGFPGVPNIPLKEVSEQHLNRQYDINNRIHAEIQGSSMPDVTEERVDGLVKQMYESVKRCIDQFNILINETKVIQERIEREQKEPAILQTGRAALAETELNDEIAYQYIIDLFNNVYARVLNIEMRRIRLSRLSPLKKSLARVALNLKRLYFLKDVARVNAGVIELAWRAKELGDMPTPELLQKLGLTLASVEENS